MCKFVSRKIIMVLHIIMATLLKLVSENAPWMFESLGVKKQIDGMDVEPSEFVESELFPQSQTFELQSGTFPLIDYRDLNAGDTHCIGGKIVKVIRFDVSLKTPLLDIPVAVEPPLLSDGGTIDSSVIELAMTQRSNVALSVVTQSQYESCIIYVE